MSTTRIVLRIHLLKGKKRRGGEDALWMTWAAYVEGIGKQAEHPRPEVAIALAIKATERAIRLGDPGDAANDGASSQLYDGELHFHVVEVDAAT